MVLFIDALFMVFLLWIGILGFKQGFVEEFGRFIGLCVSVVVASKYYTMLSGFLSCWIVIDAWMLLVTSYIIIFIIILFTMRIITKMVNFFIVTKSKKWVNKLMGFTFGFLKGSVVLSMFVWVLDLLPNEKWSEIIIQKSYLANNLKSARVQIIKSFHWEDPTLQGEKFIKEIITLKKKETP